MNAFGLSNPFQLGFVLGALGSILGAGIDFMYTKRNRRTTSVGGFLLLIAGGLNTLVGAVSILISILVTGSIRTALVLGLGVLAGFVLGFLAVAIIFILTGKFGASIDRQDQ